MRLDNGRSFPLRARTPADDEENAGEEGRRTPGAPDYTDSPVLVPVIFHYSRKVRFTY